MRSVMFLMVAVLMAALPAAALADGVLQCEKVFPPSLQTYANHWCANYDTCRKQNDSNARTQCCTQVNGGVVVFLNVWEVRCSQPANANLPMCKGYSALALKQAKSTNQGQYQYCLYPNSF